MFDFREKTVTVMGLGTYQKGSGVGAVRFLLGRAKRVIVTDIKSEKDLKEQIAQVRVWHKSLPPSKVQTEVVWHLGGHKKEDFEKADMVVRNPDVPWNSPFLSFARQNGIPIENDITLFLRIYGVEQVVGITGTRGKTTTTHLIYEMIRAEHAHARIGGNVGESPLLWFVGTRGDELIKKHPPVVLELSSFMLHNFKDFKKSPQVSVITNLYPDHLNKYKDFDEYVRDKEQIFLHQHETDTVVLNADDTRVHECAERARGRVLFFSLKKKVPDGACIENKWFVLRARGVSKKIAPVSVMKLLGAHNQANILAALCASRAYGIKPASMKKVIASFKGVPNRLELIAKGNGIAWYNDCTSTSPEAAIACLRSFPARKIILITGGNTKGSDLTELAHAIRERAREVILFPGNANKDLPEGHAVADIQEAVEKACAVARKGDVVLLSPGLTWLPVINEFKRGEEFIKEVNKRV
ncbi:MAG: UDP-N-acetylmuramoylalanine-D-glutamate ligase [Candidatus Magasanikbacteria bacterium GW2011_GWA2_45_39]|uniref:UDP-N-acetylmuramoylalanine--D-glutamate ligase n=1 Tax=Candidatus Magasanikbacteria bacterium GW2011_GWA2_45_39 TaxID=1619041 RepID=A0A0G1QGN8_9BACT|nr:MAG: UDP-N-acetylmuramoylalanine-D-glutamate ligase [Candidatus Magasanikbacteria bacterium GW2011_GWA2_45_39]HBW74085.1 UDP-N-acetylmuramoyl-L-alanine--D-glutamate ligase [Candidatus Magasanikbacteria bacterium]